MEMNVTDVTATYELLLKVTGDMKVLASSSMTISKVCALILPPKKSIKPLLILKFSWRLSDGK